MGYITIKDRAEESFVEKHSEFIGYLAPVSTEEEAIAFINEIRAKHRKATHNVYAYILRDNHTVRYSDDGEPQGTAGVPVLDVLQKRGLTDVCCVVTRYFGGILLGGGGLVRAYSHATSIAIDSATIMDMCSCYQLDFSTDYTLYGRVNYILPDYDVKILSTDFTECVSMSLLVKVENYQALHEKLIDVSNGTISVKKSEEKFMDFR
jgi:uncharacterized YigZ family protein